MALIQKIKEKRKQEGYTILEVIIVLTVGSLLFVSVLAAYNQQNRRTQFTNSVNNFAQDIQDVLNDVETGFYPSTNDFSCSVIGNGAPSIDPNISANQGTNTDCIFIGKAIHFAPGPSSSTNKADIDVYTIVGRRVVVGTTDTPAITINQEKPIGLDNLVDRKSLDAGVQISSVKSADGNHHYSGFAMVTASSSNRVSTGLNNRATLAVIIGNINLNKPNFLNRIEHINPGWINQAANGLNICVTEGVGGRTAIIELAVGESQIIVNTEIDTPCT